MEICEALARFRTSQGLRKSQVAALVGITPQAYQYYEAGTSIPSAAVIKKIATTFNVSTDYLLGLTDSPRPAPDSAALLGALLGCRDLIQTVLDNKVKSA